MDLTPFHYTYTETSFLKTSTINDYLILIYQQKTVCFCSPESYFLDTSSQRFTILMVKSLLYCRYACQRITKRNSTVEVRLRAFAHTICHNQCSNLCIFKSISDSRKIYIQISNINIYIPTCLQDFRPDAYNIIIYRYSFFNPIGYNLYRHKTKF